MDGESLDVLRSLVGDEYGIPDAMRRRLAGESVGDLRRDAKAMRAELGLDPLDDGRQRDEHGRFAARSDEAGDGASNEGSTINKLIRQAAGRPV